MEKVRKHCLKKCGILFAIQALRLSKIGACRAGRSVNKLAHAEKLFYLVFSANKCDLTQRPCTDVANEQETRVIYLPIYLRCLLLPTDEKHFSQRFKFSTMKLGLKCIAVSALPSALPQSRR